MAAVAALGCILGRLGWRHECQGRVEVHHIRAGQGMTDRASDWLVLPVCAAHHTGPLGVHYPRGLTTRTKLSELDLLAETLRALETTRRA
jgi:hypothetical protein